MKTRVFEAVWSHLSILGKQDVFYFLSRLREVTTSDEKVKSLLKMKSIIIIDNPQLENSESLNEFLMLFNP
jgi:hypothetical protein